MPSLYKFQEQAVADLDAGSRICILPTGCLAKDTPIKMADGSIKPVQDVRGGDMVLSCDNGVIVENEVECVIRTCHKEKPMIELEYDGEKITTTYDHPFYAGEEYYPLYQLVWGALEESQRAQLKLLCKQYGQAIDYETIWARTSGSNEAIPRRLWVLQNDAGRQDSKSAPYCRGELVEESLKFASDKPYQRRQNGQPSREFGVGDRKIQCLVWNTQWEYQSAEVPQQLQVQQGRQKEGKRAGFEIQRLVQESKVAVSPSESDDLVQVGKWKVTVKEAEPYYSVCMRRAPYTYCIGRKHCYITHNTGKTAVMFRWLRDTGRKRVVIITTATKARSGDMQKEAVLWNGQEWLDSLESFEVISWHKLDKYSLQLPLLRLGNYAFAFDEVQKCKGYTTGMGYGFRRICDHCTVWTGYTATPGDDWKDFITYFTVCGKVKHKTDFMNNYAIVHTYRGFPEIDHYVRVDELKKMWGDIVTTPDASQMFRELPKETHKVVEFKAPKNYRKIMKTRTKEDGEFIETTMGLCHYLRQICFTKEKQEWLSEFIEGLGDNCVFFCNYIEEEEVVCEIAKKALPKGTKIWRIDGKHHEIPTPDTIGKYDIVVAHYASGGEALNLQFMHYWCSISPNYSYSTSLQARGRIKRIGQTKPMFFYYLKSVGTIEDDIYACLKSKSDFSEKNWCKQLEEELTEGK